MWFCDTISYLIFINYVIDKYHAQMREAQQVVTEKTSALEAEAYKTKRLQVKVILPFFVSFICIMHRIEIVHS